ncbi:hypothetical protein PsorP6_013743 [Peronosclerospora sorghi]|uniref:Uncharacterized protein n=1 Tax=Peronosclerospora sorghi TaxID=230839 RepID=A0ACC0VIX3_9STRA|nr:hypothetical protein PsorP6_013743 [Peronosclerospora sorghi]
MMLRGVTRISEDSDETASLTEGKQTPVKQTVEKVENEQMQPNEEHQQKSWRQRAKRFAIEYGPVGVLTHIVLSVLSFSAIYVGVSSGVDVKAILDSVGLSNSVSNSATSSAGSFFIAYAIYKLLTPIRWPLTFAVTPIVLRVLRRRGYMQNTTNLPSSPPPTE